MKSIHFSVFCFLLLALVLVSCDKKSSNNNQNNINNINNVNNTNNTNNLNNDGGVNNQPDGDIEEDVIEWECIPGPTQCSDCIDNDNNGLIDGFDPTCLSPNDRIEGSFETGIPGDGTNRDILDCWFDGNSGGGDDGCFVHICCMLEECPASLQQKYRPEECETSISQTCVDNCLEYVSPGCDCFGCCTVCYNGECHDIFVGTPMNFPDCQLDVFNDPAYCPRCHLNQDCANPCDPSNCELCPGMTVEDLPPECNNQSQCPDGVQVCTVSTECDPFHSCSTGCCIPYVQ